MMPFDTYYTLGRSGLRVSPLALGAMTFGDAHFGCDQATSNSLIDQYLAAGGNFIDTANVYSQGSSEPIIGEYFADRGGRHKAVIATKYTMGAEAGDPNRSGNGRKSMMRWVEESLRRLKTDYIDLYYLHAWDKVTPVDEVMRGLDDLVSQGKIRHAAFSDVPAWYAASAQMLARWRGFEPLCALQLQYSLMERGIDYEFPDLCAEMGLGVVVWSPLSSGFLSGKYRPKKDGAEGEGRLAHVDPALHGRFGEHGWKVITELEKVSEEVGKSMAQVAINWVANRPFVGATILGATKADQFAETLVALDFTLEPEQIARLDAVSAPPPTFPYAFLDGFARPMIGVQTQDKRPGYYG